MSGTEATSPPADAGERRWALQKIGPGDYVCPSKDLTKLWRFHKHVDGRDHGLDVPFDERTFWRVCFAPMDVARAWRGEVPSPWDSPWCSVEEWLPTRKAAIQRMTEYDGWADV